MPNHVTSIMTIHGSEQAVKEVYDFIANPEADNEDNKVFDFNKVLPMPESLNISAPSDTESLKYVIAMVKSRFSRTEEENKLLDKVEADPQKKAEYLRLAKTITANVADHGYANWYDWRCEKWGTKWNCYEVQRLEGGSILFQTAWAMPEGVMEALSKRFPDVSVEVIYADEDLFSNCGHITYVGGEVAESNIPNSGTKEAYDIVMEVMPEYQDFYEWDDEKNEIKYNEEDE